MATNEAYKKGWEIPLTVGASVDARSPVVVGKLTGVALTPTGASGTTTATVLRHGVCDLEVKGITDAVKLSFASVTAGQTIIFNTLTFTAHATVTTKASRQFKIDGTDAQDAAEFASCVNDASNGAPGVKAIANGADVILVSDKTISAITGTAVRQANSARSAGAFEASSALVDLSSCFSRFAFVSGSCTGMPCSLNSTMRQSRAPGTPS